MSVLAEADAARLLYAEAAALDEKRWKDWLALYAEDAIFWVPAWISEHEPTRDPDRELSLIYYRGRANLDDRIWRLQSGDSVASRPLRRTAHVISNVRTEAAEPQALTVHSLCAAHQFDPGTRRQHVFFSHYLHRLRQDESGWRIAEKRITLLNDYIPAVADVYLL